LTCRFGFEHDAILGVNNDGGVIEFSIDGGSTWFDAGGLIDGGQTYGGPLSTMHANPLGGREAFVRTSFGYTGSRVNLESLAGYSVRFRFRVGSDTSVGDLGWSVDNVSIYVCTGSSTGEFLQNGDFADGGSPPSTPPTSWLTFAIPEGSMLWNVTNGVFQFARPAGNTQGVVFQQTGITVAAGAPLEAVFDIGNSMTARKRISVLIHDADFTDLFVCTFWLDPGAVLRTYRMRTHTTKAWANATISFYAANTGNEGGGFYRLDKVSLRYKPGTQSDVRTDCIDPTAGAGGTTGSNLLTNGGFDGGGIAPWATFGQISFRLFAGVFEFFKLAGSPAGVVLQSTGQAMSNDQRMMAAFGLGNSSEVRQRVTILLHEGDFSDLAACTFWVRPGLPLSGFAMRSYATKTWSNATMSVYPATVGTSPTHEWLRLDSVVFRRTTSGTPGTECFEPGAPLTTSIDFSRLTSGSPFVSYDESGFTVLPTLGSWEVLGYGRPAPSIIFRHLTMDPATTGEVQITAAPAFRFHSVDLYSSVTQIPYTISGFLNSSLVYTLSNTLPGTFGNFVTVQNPNEAHIIDTLLIRLTNPALSNPMGLDNIVVSY